MKRELSSNSVSIHWFTFTICLKVLPCCQTSGKFDLSAKWDMMGKKMPCSYFYLCTFSRGHPTCRQMRTQACRTQSSPSTFRQIKQNLLKEGESSLDNFMIINCIQLNLLSEQRHTLYRFFSKQDSFPKQMWEVLQHVLFVLQPLGSPLIQPKTDLNEGLWGLSRHLNIVSSALVNLKAELFRGGGVLLFCTLFKVKTLLYYQNSLGQKLEVWYPEVQCYRILSNDTSLIYDHFMTPDGADVWLNNPSGQGVEEQGFARCTYTIPL